jgi:putative salt-induced outer membrane protein
LLESSQDALHDIARAGQVSTFFMFHHDAYLFPSTIYLTFVSLYFLSTPLYSTSVFNIQTRNNMKKIQLAALATSLVAATVTSTVVFADPAKEDGQWRGAFSAGLAVASGNTKSTNFNASVDMLRATKEDKITLFLTSLYGTRDVAGKNEKTANLTRGGVRYDWNLSDRMFVFGLLEAEQDKIQRLDSRFIGGAGVGYKVIKEKDTSFDLFAGLTGRRDSKTVTVERIAPLVGTFDQKVTSTSTELLLGEESNHKLSDSVSFKQRLAVYPNLKNSGEYRAQFDSGLVVGLAAGVNLQVSLSDRYNSEAAFGTKKSDLLFLTGINISLGAK